MLNKGSLYDILLKRWIKGIAGEERGERFIHVKIVFLI